MNEKVPIYFASGLALAVAGGFLMKAMQAQQKLSEVEVTTQAEVARAAAETQRQVEIEKAAAERKVAEEKATADRLLAEAKAKQLTAEAQQSAAAAQTTAATAREQELKNAEKERLAKQEADELQAKQDKEAAKKKADEAKASADAAAKEASQLLEKVVSDVRSKCGTCARTADGTISCPPNVHWSYIADRVGPKESRYVMRELGALDSESKIASANNATSGTMACGRDSSCLGFDTDGRMYKELVPFNSLGYSSALSTKDLRKGFFINCPNAFAKYLK